jgi:hypothetical protein
MGLVEKDELIECIKKFLAAMRVEDRCCGTCGLRDPDGDYTQSCRLTTLENSHWAVVPQQALNRLNALPPFQLFKKGVRGADTGADPDVEVHRRDVHHLHIGQDAAGNRREYHVVTAAVTEDTCYLCKRCNKAWDAAVGEGKNRARTALATKTDGDVYDDFSDLYNAGAPTDSIAAGDDYGRLQGLARKDIDARARRGRASLTVYPHRIQIRDVSMDVSTPRFLEIYSCAYTRTKLSILLVISAKTTFVFVGTRCFTKIHQASFP